MKCPSVWCLLELVCCRLKDSAGADVAAAVVGLGVLALGDTATACRVDEMEGVVLIHTGNDAHVAHAATAWTALEEHQVTRLQVVFLDAYAIGDLAAWWTVQLNAETLEYITGKTGAVKSTGRWCAITVWSAAETIGILDDLVNDVVAADLFELFEYGALLASLKKLSLGWKTGKGDC